MQQNTQLIRENQSLNPPQLISNFHLYLQNLQNFIENDLIPLITAKQTGLAHSNYPVKSLKSKKGRAPKQQQQGTWYDVRSKLERKIQAFKKSPKQHDLILTSDLLVWSIPNICSSYIAMKNYLRKLKAQSSIKITSQEEAERDQFCKLLLSKKEEKNLYKVFLQKNPINEINLLKVPLSMISNYFEKWMGIIKYYEEKEEYFKDLLLESMGELNQNKKQTHDHQKQGYHQNRTQNQHAKRLKTLLNRAKLEKMEIQNRVKQAQKYIQDIQGTESVDPQIYKNRLILKQYTAQLSPKNKYLYRYGKRLLFITTLKKRCIKAQKHLKQRKDAIFQVIDKEKFYIDVLNEYITYIKHPIEALNILTKQQNNLLFGQIEQIKRFHEYLYQLLAKRFQDDHKYQIYGDIIKNLIPYFKLYVYYIYNAETAQNFLIKLNKQNDQVKAIWDKFFIEKYKTASDEMLQPTFKIARYENLFKQIIKNSNPSTADYNLFIEVDQLFKNSLTNVNDEVDRIIRRNKLNQLQREFGTPQQPIFTTQKCEYLKDFSVLMVHQEKLINVILFAFTHLILIVEQMTKKKLKYIIVDQKFYVRRQDDSKFYRNVIKIHSQEGFLTLSTGSEQKNLNKVVQMYEVLKKVQKITQSNQLIYVQVLGTQQIGSTSFAKYTEYIIEVKYLALKKLLHLRFSEVANIVKVMQNFYKDSLGITEQQTLKKTWFNNHKSKTIEDRKRTIEQILQKLFNHELIKKQPKFLLNYLNLPENFFQNAKKLSIQKNTSALMSSLMKKIDRSGDSTLASHKSIEIQSSGTFTLPGSAKLHKKESHLSRKQMKEAFTLLCATQIKLGRDIYHDFDEELQTRKQKAQKVQIYINTMKQDEHIMVRVTEYDTVQDVCNKMSKLIGLRSNRDFRLFHEIGKKELRVLEHQQLILKIFTFPQPKRQSIASNVSSMFQSMTSSLKKIVSPDNHPTLIFKKYYFLPFEIQQRQFKKDLTRLRLLTYQVFSEIKDLKYQLIFDDYLFFAACLIYIETDGDITKNKIQEQIVHRVIPETIFKLKNYTEEQWLIKIQPHLLYVQQEIKKVILHNQEQLKYNNVKNDIQTKIALSFGHRHLASQIVLNKIKKTKIYGSNLFYIQPYKKTYEQLKQQSLKIAYNMWLAVKVDSLSLLTPSSKQSQFELKYSDIQKINVYSEAIVFKTDDYINKQYRFNTYQSFEISQLVKYYKTLNQILNELGEDQKLVDEVRKYRNQIEQYRSTYEVHDDMKTNANMH